MFNACRSSIMLLIKKKTVNAKVSVIIPNASPCTSLSDILCWIWWITMGWHPSLLALIGSDHLGNENQRLQRGHSSMHDHAIHREARWACRNKWNLVTISFRALNSVGCRSDLGPVPCCHACSWEPMHSLGFRTKHVYSGPSIVRTPLAIANSSGVWNCSDKWNEKLMVLDNFPVVLTIAIELLNWETLLYAKK